MLLHVTGQCRPCQEGLCRRLQLAAGVGPVPRQVVSLLISGNASSLPERAAHCAVVQDERCD